MLLMTSHEEGWPFRVKRCADDFACASVWDVVHALAALVLDNVALRIELGEVERVEQEAHPIHLEPQRGFQEIGGDGLVIVRPIVVGRLVLLPPTSLVSRSCSP